MMDKTSKHIPVLVQETLGYLQLGNGGTYLDCTFGGGGHSREILRRIEPDGHVYALDRDGTVAPFAEELSREFPDRLKLFNLAYDRLDELDAKFDGILFDLGISSDQLEASGRGFSFSRNEPLDMRFDERSGQNASQLLMQTGAERLERIFRDLAEDRQYRSLVRKIVDARRREPIRTTNDFMRIVGTTQPSVLAPLFQALRIEVNDELHTLKIGLEKAAAALKDGGRLVVISFHSLEDRIVKEFMRENMTVVTKKPVIPSLEEQRSNPRSRSAKLRSAIKSTN
ncbi:MAG: 16S rRNA (cytosine(1402)-N(4))-methyltransferase RsmH [Candidatus Berkelbacteria bacterium]|nr:MAG: 16S rRNA (cytosine(1402)-N(4))-methyltransferase RsmH [Candidatus Berkelbacteria bacterium]QQG51495.1 MAG: 16S rRNA (cytosine(1402)-N(4))-methyltransferase RsmH [Candidatus Berkelbacteria bacterium]